MPRLLGAGHNKIAISSGARAQLCNQKWWKIWSTANSRPLQDFDIKFPELSRTYIDVQNFPRPWMWESRTFKNFPDVRTMQGRLRFLKGAPPNQPGQGSNAQTWNEVSFDPGTQWPVDPIPCLQSKAQLNRFENFAPFPLWSNSSYFDGNIFHISYMCTVCTMLAKNHYVMFEFVKVMPLFSGHSVVSPTIWCNQKGKAKVWLFTFITARSPLTVYTDNSHLNFKSWKDNKILSEVVLMTYDKICKLYTVAWMNVIPRAWTCDL